MKKKILILNPYYLPGYKGGGPIQSCYNLIENLHDEFEFYVLCSDRDLKSENAYPNIKINDWNKVENANVYYMSPDKQNFKGFKELLNKFEYDILYLNGFFSPKFTIIPLVLTKLNKIKKTKVVLTPRGDFTGGCENKKIKKYTYIFMAKILGLYNNLIWHATSQIEEKDIKKKFPKAKTFIIENLTTKFVPKELITSKKEGELKLVFVSRMFPKKNLKYALEVLKNIDKGNVIYDIYGPLEDKEYWAECQKLIKKLPSNVKVTYCGELPHNQIASTYQKYHAFFFPTLGENYGHVIVEAMMNNCLCVLSKETTPWDEYIDLLDIGAKLENQENFINIIKRLLDYSEEDFRKAIEINNNYILNVNDQTKVIEEYKKILKGI